MRVRSSPLAFFALFLTCCATANPSPIDDTDVVDLTPDEPPAWSVPSLLAPVNGLFHGGARYWYARRVIDVDTTPSGAMLELFYVRENLQKRYEQVEAPARVSLPPRGEAGGRDFVKIRALLDGYREHEVQIAVRGRDERVVVDLVPVRNALVGFTHSSIGGRGSLEFRTRERLAFRVQTTEQGFQIALIETTSTREADETIAGAGSSLVAGIEAHQLGDDLVVSVLLTDRGRSDAIEARYRRSLDLVRGLQTFSIDLVPRDLPADFERTHAALAAVSPRNVTGCSLAFDRALRAALDPAALARASAPSGSYADAFVQDAMRRLGEISPGGAIRMVDGRRLRSQRPIERIAAATHASEAIGYLALLRTAVALIEEPPHRRTALQGLIAPELPASSFATVLDRAESAERDCAGSGG
jgi:hypothetical protein